MFSCTTDKYDTLYARWLEHSGDLLDLAGWKPGMRLLDFCGGTGAVTREALRRGAEPQTLTLYDTRPRLSLPFITQVSGDAAEVGDILYNRSYDVVVCRQAVAYLNLHSHVFQGVCDILKTGGVFVFNSFIRPKWAWKKYEYKRHRYIEASGFIGRWVMHLQWCRGAGWDISLFRWHTEEEIQKALTGFNVEIYRSERGLRWICTKPMQVQVKGASA